MRLVTIRKHWGSIDLWLGSSHGLRLRRYAEWLELVRRAPPGTVLRMFSAIFSGRVNRAEWRRRMYVCYRCPVHNRVWDSVNKRWTGMHACRSAAPGYETLGCGCFTPLLTIAREPYASDKGRGCWGRAVQGPPFGW